MTIIARGIRNNNPGNIRKGQDWQGLSESQTDASFDQFVSAEWGIRAIVKILLSYKSKGIDTISEIINTWAPSKENNTKAYINSVAVYTKIDKDKVIDVTDISITELLVEAIIMHENGIQPYSQQTIKDGIALALDENVD